MENYSFLLCVFCVVLLLIIGRVFIIPVKKIIRLIINSIFGIALMYLINIFGANYGFHLGINWWTTIISGILGVPGVILVVILKLIL